jgi:glutamyl-tRNA synthetase
MNIDTAKLKTRFAPSPTGYMHVGNCRTALFNALFALKHQRPFLLRIEDSDQQRSEQVYSEALQQDLQNLGIVWQQGPYLQSQRSAIYEEYYQQLIQAGLAYPCFCTEQQLALTRKLQRAAGEPPRYPGTCAQLTPEEVAAKLQQGLKPSLRFRVPRQQPVVFDDLVRGHQRFNSSDLGDFIIRKQDGTPSFMFCNAIDDALMEVSHVLRGEDHLTNTPRQLLILQALGLPQPCYGHISIILGDDGSPLSKRNGSRSIADLLKQGYLPLALVNYLARLGLRISNNQLLTLAELAAEFDLSALVKSAAKYDPNQLDYWQKEAVMQTEPGQLWQWMAPQVAELVPADKQGLFVSAIAGNTLMPTDAKHWARLLFNPLQLDDQALGVLKTAGVTFLQRGLALLNQSSTMDWPAFSQALKTQSGLKGKTLFQPLRAVLLGRLAGPELAQIAQLLGLAGVKQRFTEALAVLTGD